MASKRTTRLVAAAYTKRGAIVADEVYKTPGGPNTPAAATRARRNRKAAEKVLE